MIFFKTVITKSAPTRDLLGSGREDGSDIFCNTDFQNADFQILEISVSRNVRAPALPNHPRLAEGITGGEDFVTNLQISLANVKLSKYDPVTLSESLDTVL